MSTYAVTMLLSSVSDDSSRESMGSSSLEVDQRHAPGARHLHELVLDAVHGRREREHVLAHLHVGVGGERMPEDAVQVYSHLGHQVGHAQHQSLPGVTTACEWPNEMVFIRNTEGSMKLAQLLQVGRIDGRLRGAQSDAKAARLESPN